jgi:glycogen debranching enzyme
VSAAAEPRIETEASGQPPYAVGSSLSLQERQYRTLKNADMFGVFDLSGNIQPYPGGTEGLYNRDTRHLSVFDLTIGGGRPVLLSSTLRDDNGAMICDLANPDLVRGDEVMVEHSVIHMRRTRFMINATCFERIQLRSFSSKAHLIRLEIAFDADFKDLFEVRGTPRAKHGRIEPAELTDSSVTLAYNGLDDKRRQTRLRFSPTPTTLDGGQAISI